MENPREPVRVCVRLAADTEAEQGLARSRPRVREVSAAVLSEGGVVW